MIAVIYRFNVKEGSEGSFEEAWMGLTKLLYTHAGSHGSRLHVNERYEYIAYAQWPDKETMENANSKLPSSATKFRNQMKAACNSIETLYKLKVIEDLLVQPQADSDTRH